MCIRDSNTKRALVEEGGVIEWVSGSFGSHVGCLYPMSVLKGDNSKMEFTGVTFAGAGQNLDTGAKVMDIRTKDAAVGHEAKIGSISNEAVFYLMSRGMSEEDARALIVSGFADNVSKELPLEYAVEMNNLIRLEMKGSIG